MEEKIRAGEIDIGESIVERKYTKKKFDKSTGQLVDHVFSVFGRKHPLLKIHVKLFNKCKKFMRLNPDSYFENISKEELTKRLLSIGEFIHETESLSDMKERLKQYERTRHLHIWHGGSCIANHGHILFCINVLYDPAVFYTSAEYTILANIDTNVQREVESPQLYIIGRCGSNDEQLACINTRVDDLNGTKIGLKLCEIEEKYENIVLRDIMRFFHGDGPSAALEAGNQKGGYYFCPSCDVHLCQTDNIAYCYQQKTRSLAEKQNLVVSGTFGKINSLKK